MKERSEVSAAKLRGGFYTPRPVADYCVDEVRRLTKGALVQVLEPSAGDGAFLPSLAAALPAASITCVELNPAEAQKCGTRLADLRLDGAVYTGSFVQWSTMPMPEPFDAVVANPPFVRFQFFDPEEAQLARRLLADREMGLGGVANLWVPITLLALDRLRIGGAFAIVLPEELLTTISAGLVREELLRSSEQLQIRFFDRGTFVGLLQDVVVVSGRRCAPGAGLRKVVFAEGSHKSGTRWSHTVTTQPDSWRRYLLRPRELEAYEHAALLPLIGDLNDVARFGVSIVTGANAFFTVSDEVVHAYGLGDWAMPLLARSADSPGLVITTEDHGRARKRSRPAWLLNFSADRPEPTGPKVAAYLAEGKRQGLHERYKCRIREPWYRVPGIRAGELLMSKRCHHHPRVVLNEAGLLTTDTIYRGRMLPDAPVSARDVVASFHSSLTLLSAELTGRSYGGGVLELVPSEISRLRLPIRRLGAELPYLDELSRATGGQTDDTGKVNEATDALLCEQVPGYRDVVEMLASAREQLLTRRHRP